MQSITFAQPTLTTAQMTRQDQIDVSVNQATAAIVCCYLEHMNTAINKGIAGSTSASGGISPLPGVGLAGANQTGPADIAFLTTTELVSLINSVQGALRLIT